MFSQCAAALEHLAAFRFREMVEADDAAAPAKLANEHDLFAAQLATLLHMIVFEECTNQWSLSRPLLALILISEDAYAQWKEQALQSMASHPSRQQKLALAFEKLMTEVPRGKQANLDVKTRDKPRRTCRSSATRCARSCSARPPPDADDADDDDSGDSRVVFGQFSYFSLFLNAASLQLHMPP